jgi:hypothetical protein
VKGIRQHFPWLLEFLPLDWQIILSSPEYVERKPRPLAQLNKDVVGCDLTRQAPIPASTRNDVELYGKRLPHAALSLCTATTWFHYQRKESGRQLAVGKPESTYYRPSAALSPQSFY